MKNGVRYALLWGPLALTVKNWVIDVQPIDGHVSLHHGAPTRDLGQTDWVLIQKYKIKVQREFRRGQIIYLRSPEKPGGYWVRRLVGLEGDVVSIYDTDDIETVPQGHCWVEPCEDDWVNSCCAVPLALIEGHISHVLWPPSQAGTVQIHLPYAKVLVEGSKTQQKTF